MLKRSLESPEYSDTHKDSRVSQLEITNVSLLELKALAKRLLPSGSILRDIILSEPDLLPREEAFALMPVFVILLYKEVGRT